MHVGSFSLRITSSGFKCKEVSGSEGGNGNKAGKEAIYRDIDSVGVGKLAWVFKRDFKKILTRR